jgi:hypothetical protein
MSDEIIKDQSAVMARLDERTQAIQQSIQALRTEITDQSRLLTDRIKSTEDNFEKKIKENEKQVEDLEDFLLGNFVKKEEFDPIKKFVWGLIGLVLLTVAGSLLTLVVFKPGP